MKADRGGFSASHRWGVHAQRCARSPGDAPHTLFRGSHGDSGTMPARGCCSGDYLPPRGLLTGRTRADCSHCQLGFGLNHAWKLPRGAEQCCMK